MFTLPWLQMSGAIAGGVVGSFSGFIANSFHEHRTRIRVRRNIACALIGEIGALSQWIDDNYLALLRARDSAPDENRDDHYHHFRGDRDYMPVFRSIGATVGFLPTPLPRDLVAWYTNLAAALERAHALHEFAIQARPEQARIARDLALAQRAALTELVETAKPLLARLSAL
jgi:hypothetical protein